MFPRPRENVLTSADAPFLSFFCQFLGAESQPFPLPVAEVRSLVSPVFPLQFTELPLSCASRSRSLPIILMSLDSSRCYFHSQTQEVSSWCLTDSDLICPSPPFRDLHALSIVFEAKFKGAPPHVTVHFEPFFFTARRSRGGFPPP